HQDRLRRHGPCVVLRRSGRRLLAGRQAQPGADQRPRRRPEAVGRAHDDGARAGADRAVVLCAESRDRRPGLRPVHQPLQGDRLRRGGAPPAAGDHRRYREAERRDRRGNGRTEGDADVTVLLADVCTITMGQAPPGTSYNDREECLPLLAGAGDFRGSRIAPSKFITQPKKSSAEGDIILSIRASIGAKVWADREYCLGRGVAGLRPGPQLSARYLWHWLSHSERALAAKGRGATFLQVNRSDIGEMPIDLPSLDEQRRIAAILDRADAVRAKRRQVLAHLDSLTQSIFHSMFGAILDRTTLGEVFEVSTGSTPSRKDPGNYGGSTPWVKTAEVHGVITETEEHVTSNGISAARLRL